MRLQVLLCKLFASNLIRYIIWSHSISWKASLLEARGWKTPDNFLFSKVWEALKCTSILTEHKHPVVCFHSSSGGLWGLGNETENNFMLHQRSRDKVAVQLIGKLRYNFETIVCYIRGRKTLCNTINWGVGPGPDLAGPSVSRTSFFSPEFGVLEDASVVQLITLQNINDI